jgi:lysophospholipase L1-like esterase
MSAAACSWSLPNYGPRSILLVFGILFCQAGLSTLARAQSFPTVNDDSPASPLLAPYRAASLQKWEDDIKKLEARDASEHRVENGTLFIGSSSIRMWKSIATDMAPFRPIERGFGGSTFSDVAVFAPRILSPHAYQALVVFVANDVTGGDGDKSPQEVGRLVRHLIGVSQQIRPNAPIVLIEITPTPKRFAVWSKIREVNAVLREVALSEKNVYFVATAESFLTPDNQPRAELFVEDQLHLNSSGYQLWTQLITPILHSVISRHTTPAG